MVHIKRGLPACILVLALLLAAANAAAQPQQPPAPRPPGGVSDSTPFKRWEWHFQQRAYPLGKIPEGARLRALEEIARAKARAQNDPQAGAGGRWVSIGPAPINGGQIGATLNARPGSGRVTAIAVDPTDNTHWLVGTAQGGVWESPDSGTTWTPRTDDQASLALGAIAFAPSDPKTIYAGTGEANFSCDSYAGVGLLKSMGGGTTWGLLATSDFAGAAFSDIKVDPTNRDILLAATARGFAGDGSCTSPPPLPHGILKSVTGGTSFSPKLDGEATSLIVHPGNFINQYAGIGDSRGSPVNGVYRSRNAGEVWTPIAGPWKTPPLRVGRIALAIAPSNPDVLYVSIEDSGSGGGTKGGLLGLWKTSNAWDTTPTWTPIPAKATDDGTGTHGYCGWDTAYGIASDQCWYDHVLSVDPTDSKVLYAGGTSLWRYDGTTWADIGKTASDPTHGIHADQHAMAWVGNRLIVGNDGGVWSTTNGGATWNNHNTTLAITQFYAGSLHPTDPGFALGGSQDNGTDKFTGTTSWQQIFYGDGASSAISSSRPATHWAVSLKNLNIQRTTDGGTKFFPATAGIDPTGAPFIARFEKCSANDDVFIAGTDNLWKSTAFFSSASPSWASNGPEMGEMITALAFAASDATCGTYAYGTQSGQLRITPDGVNWFDLDPASHVPNRYVTGLAFHPSNRNVLYVTLSGFDGGTPGQPGHVFATTNALSGSPAWFNVSPPVNLPHNSVVFDPFSPNVVYVGTDIGVWKSTTGGTSWTHLGPETGMPNVAVFDLKIPPTMARLVAFTHGRGAFVLGLGPDLVAMAVSNPPASAHPGDSFAVTDTVQNYSSFPVGASTTQYYLSRDGRGRDVALSGSRAVPGLTPWAASTGTVTVRIPTLSDRGGAYYLLACADGPGTIVEADEANNCLASETTVTVVVPRVPPPPVPPDPRRPVPRPGGL